jgi:hypothetical protein
MKITFLKITYSLRMALVVAATVTFLHQNATADTINLGTAASFGVLGGSAVTSTGNTVVNGNLGLWPGTSVTGFFPPGIVNGTMHVNDAVAQQAQADLTTAYNQAASLARTGTLTGQDLGLLTLTPGVYFFASSAQLTGKLTLDGQGLTDPVFVFQIGSTLTTASSSSFDLINGASACDIFWQVGSSATLGSGSFFDGTILALSSISVTDSVIVDGGLLARNGAVTLINDTITVPDCNASVPDTGSTLLLLGSGLGTLLAFRRRFFSPA